MLAIPTSQHSYRNTIVRPMPPMEIDGTRLQARRKQLGLTQDDVEARTHGAVTQSTIAKLERGKTRGKSRDMQDALAAALETNAAWLCGASDDPTPAAGARIEHETPAREPDDDATPLERALFAVMDAGAYEPADFDAARATIRETFRFMRPEGYLEGVALGLLQAARQLRTEGQPINAASISARAFSSRHADLQRKQAAMEADDDAARRARMLARGEDPDHIPDAVRAAQERDRKRKEREQGE